MSDLSVGFGSLRNIPAPEPPEYSTVACSRSIDPGREGMVTPAQSPGFGVPFPVLTPDGSPALSFIEVKTIGWLVVPPTALRVPSTQMLAWVWSHPPPPPRLLTTAPGSMVRVAFAGTKREVEVYQGIGSACRVVVEIWSASRSGPGRPAPLAETPEMFPKGPTESRA